MNATGGSGRPVGLRGRRVCVAGLGVSGLAAARALAALSAHVIAVDSRDDEARGQAGRELSDLGVTVRLGPALPGRPAAGPGLPEGIDLVVASPGLAPDGPLFTAAAAAGIEVLSEVELAWRLRPELPGGGRQQWLAVTGTNGKTTTVRMLAAMLGAAGLGGVAAGNIGNPAITVVTGPDPVPVLAVELSSFQLHWTTSMAPLAAAILNIAAHHLDWHGDLGSYTRAKAKIYAPGTIAVCNADDPPTVALARASAATRVVPCRLGEPGPGELGVAGGSLVDRAFTDGAVRLAGTDDVRPGVPHNIADALAAAALARGYGLSPDAIRAGLVAFRPDPHRIQRVARVGGVEYVDDSKASNPHAAAAALAGFSSVVWVAGGLFRGTESDLDELVRTAARRLRGVVVLGADRDKFRRALARHAPDVPVAEAVGTDTGVMDQVVCQAARLAAPGDTVLLAPAAQSFDMFRDYPARGDAFAAAVARLAAR